METLNPALLSKLLYFLGAGFLVFNLYLFLQYDRNRRLQRAALVTWPPPRPPLYRLFLWVGAVLAIVIFYKLAVLRTAPQHVFGETMMLVYYVYAMPLGLKIRRGLYEDGIWTDGGYIAYGNIGGLTWREGEQPILVILYRWRSFARRLSVPQPVYGEARKVLRQKIAAHDIHFTGKSLDLGVHDERDDV
ncbi:MAG TPA: hypothetical protein VGI12_00195 [Vicinamibacterales bacterium]